jgi:SAM-dependent methyltransferase
MQENPRQSSFCSVCGHKNVSFEPLPEFYRDNSLRYGYLHFGKGEMTSLDTYACGLCGASDRERLYAIWVDQQIEGNVFCRKTRVIHFAPEAAFSAKLKKIDLFDYSTADLLMAHADHKVDMMSMPFDDESFDFFICSHVLEHVDSDDMAIKELFRITKRGGCGILMAPIIVGLANTLEDPNMNDEASRWRLYGQYDHVRLYAHDDYVNKIRSHGFRIEELGERHFGEEVFRSLGLKPTSILYVVKK